jgi:cytochrome d ubiquinol oxidase subunit I
MSYTDCCAPLIAFVVVYSAVFGFGIWYILRLMFEAPHAGELGPGPEPTRAAGITPSPSVAQREEPQ